jgi:hypothetical protein
MHSAELPFRSLNRAEPMPHKSVGSIIADAEREPLETVTGTATKPPPVAPQGDPHSAIERAAWFAGGGG